MKTLVFSLVIALCLPSLIRCGNCTYTKYKQEYYRRRCGFMGWDRCGAYRAVAYEVSRCCDGWIGSECDVALCNNQTDGCSLREGMVRLRNGTVYTNGGGSCVEPDVCEGCNPGFYASGPYCEACELANCLHPECTTPDDAVCKYCEGEIKEQYGWYAYTRFYPGDEHKCRQACSWRPGSRCYPGTCSDQTPNSCRCTDGFKGPDCATITEAPNILQNSIRLTELTDTSANHVDAPADSSGGSPQDITWANNAELKQFTANVDASYKKDLPTPPEHFYVNLDQTKIGIVNGGFTLEWIRGSTTVEDVIRIECESEPTPTNYRCESTGSVSDHNWHGPFEHQDILKFTVFATNGGYVSVYNRENNDRIDKYIVSGETTTRSFEIQFDLERPEHCVMDSAGCSTQPLTLQDLTEEASISLRWSGWNDPTSGLSNYAFEVFSLIPTGNDPDSQLVYGEMIRDAVIAQVTPDVSQTMVTLPSAGLYAVTVSAYDIAGNHRTARRFVIFDDNSVVSLQGTRTFKADSDGSCTWKTYPSHPLVTNADPNASCDWITRQLPVIDLAWRERFINVKHQSGKYLNPVQPAEATDPIFDDGDGIRTTEKIDNVLGITSFEVAYNVTFESETTRYPYVKIDNLQAQRFSIVEDIVDGMKLNMQIRASDIFGSFAEDAIEIKVDTSPPEIEDLRLMKGDIRTFFVHNVEDLTRLQIEWEVFDIHSGLGEMKWRIFDNFTGTDIDHGTAYLSPQGDTKNKDQCISIYGDYPRGADCYCTPFEGCFHRHFQVKPQIDMRGTNGLHKTKHLGIHDSDYFLEVSATNKAMLKTTQTVKLTIDISPPVAGAVHEGAQGEPEIDFQQEKTVKVHWNDFFDRESGIWMYRFGYGAECLKPEDFDIETGKELTQTYRTEASFAVEKEGTYFVTASAYNYALDHSTPVCSDGVTIDTSLASVSEFEVEGAKVDPRLLRDDAGYLWFLHDDRTRQRVVNSNKACRASAIHIPNEQIELIPIRRNYRRIAENISSDVLGDCSSYLVDSVTVLSVINDWKYINVSWTVIESKSGIYDFEIGISSTKTEVPDVLDFQSSNHHTHLTISHPNLNDGSLFYFTIKTVSRSGVENVQSVGPFILLSTRPSFNGEIVVNYHEENGKEYLIASWDENAFEDVHKLVKLYYQFAVGTSRYGADVHPFSNLNFLSSCKSTVPPSCTAVSISDLAWDIHHGHEYYITIRVNNTAGLISKQCSKPYKHDVLAPSAGIVIDVDPNAPHKIKDNDDIDYQKSKTSLSGRWYGFKHFYSSIDYTSCITDEAGIVLKDTCKFVGTDTNATLEGAELQVFKKYKVKVIAETDVTSVSASSDGVIIIDPNIKLTNVIVHDGKPCSGDTVLLEKEKTHYGQDVLHSCSNDITHQASVHKLSSYWEIPDEWKLFTPDLFWHIEERAPTVDYWTPRTEDVHTSSSSAEISVNFPLIPGRSYRFALKFCAAEICYNTLYTNGVTVIPNPPKTGQIFISYSAEAKKIEATFESFYDADIEKLTEAQEVMDFYEWNIADNDARGRVAKTWNRLNNIYSVNETHMQFAIELEDEIQFTKCWNLLLKGTNKVGLYSVLAKNIKPCHNPEMVKTATVIDCVASHSSKDSDVALPPIFAGDPVVLGVNEDWARDDMDYTPYTNIISAVWPKLRYNMYNWAVIEIHNNDPVLYYSDNPVLRNPCDSPESISCNTTGKNYVNVYFDAEPLKDGHRYAVCIHAEATVLEHEYWKEELPEISICSDGITIDTTPPSPGNVWLYRRNAIYQSSNSEVTVNWERFVDIEELGKHVHASGISHYMVALGSHFGGVDVVPLTNVGICSHYTFHNLKLQDGHSYFATVVGYDFNGRHSNRTSAAIVIDTLPPVKSNKRITIGKRFITDQSNLEACWQEVFSDPDSGMASYKWGLGSQPGYDDKYSFTETVNTCSQTAEGQSLTLDEGHSYFVTVLGFNNAGLFSTATSWAYTVDTTPPVSGYVNDGERKPGGTFSDFDYQTEGSVIFAHWGGFSDPHTAMKEFLVSVGTTKGGQDVVETQEVGLDTEIEIRHLQLRDGMTYYVSVRACNVADLCTTATSDGILIDSSPPVPGRVIDGTGNKDIRYQASRTFVGAKWFGFTDPQSGLSHFTWRVGTAALADDIVPAREIHLNEIAVIPDLMRVWNKQLPTGKLIYNTIRAYNKGGLFSEASSNGFMVDNTSPMVIMPLTHVPIGSLQASTSVLRSSLKVKWSVEDSESFISRQYLSIAAHRGDDFNTSSKIGGFIRDYTFTKLQFHDGSLYNIKLIACNGAKLCVSSTLPNLLVDSSPPIAGTFASHTDHAVSHKLDRQPESWMVWESSKIHLAWLGFSDIHSGIQEYHINIGSSFMASDLNKDQNQPYVVPSQSMEEEEEDDFVQTRTINTQTVKNDEHIFISMWAVNGVGMKSEIIHSQFLLLPGGHMRLMRRCNSQTCHGHCVCAAQDLKCAIDSKMGSCVDKTGDTTYSVVEVQDVISMTNDLDDSLIGSHTPTDMMLSAKWSWKSGAKPLWYEWSVGETDYSTPLGITESDGRVWRDAGPLLSWTFTLPKDSYLLEGERYSFFVRAWYNENTFSDFKSKGVVIQISAPQTTSLFGKAVKEIRDNSPDDIDFVRPDDVFFVSWDGKFKNADTSVSRYRIFISSEPNGHDAYVSEEDIAPHTTRFNLTGIYKEANTRFYTNIIAYNTADLSTVVSSDSCQIDEEIPVAGVVFDGLGYREKSFQNTTSIMSASWQGFVDLGSSLQSYQWCVSSADSVGSCNILPLENVGLVTRAERKLLSPVTNGIKLVSEIFARDQVGHNSRTTLSNGVIVDETPPVRLHHVFYGENLLTNPSFENTPSAVSLDDLEINNTCLFDNPTDWIVSDDGCSVIVTAAADMVEDGISFLALKGSISQTLSQLNIQSFYRLQILTSHLPLQSATRSNNEGFVEFDGNKHLLMLYSKPRRSDDNSVQLSWHLHTFVFKPRSEEIQIKVGSYENTNGLAIDNIQLQESFTKENDAREAEGHIEVHTVFQHDWSSVHASWNFYDGESGIKEYFWAIGTVQGGIQLQDFKSVGERAFASNSDIFLPHNATIYVTVVAVNGAGIRAVTYSDPVRVDLTPPVFEYVSDGTSEGKNLAYQDSWHIGVNFKISDPESAISSCSWGIGIQPGDVSLRPFKVIASGLNSAEETMKNNDNFKTLFVTVRCTNKAGLQATMSSDGITILERKPTSDVLAVELLGQSPSQYVAHSNYHGTRGQLRIRLTGFGEDQLIDKYKIALKGPGYDFISYLHEYSPGYIYAKFNDLTLEDGLYNITVVGINPMDIKSDPLVTSVTVLTVPPKIKADIAVVWNRSQEEVSLSWSDVFLSDSPLYYEVSTGSVRGSGDIIQWQETLSTKLIFALNQDGVGPYGKTIYVVVRAISLSGTYSTAEKDQLITLDD